MFIFVLKHNKYPTLKSSLYMSYPSHNYHTRNSNDMLLPYLRVEATRMNFCYQFVKVWLGVPDYIKYQRHYQSFENAPTDFSLYSRLYFFIRWAIYFLIIYNLIIIVG